MSSPNITDGALRLQLRYLFILLPNRAVTHPTKYQIIFTIVLHPTENRYITDGALRLQLRYLFILLPNRAVTHPTKYQIIFTIN